MSSGLWGGTPGLWDGTTGLWSGTSGLWSGASGLVDGGGEPPPTVIPANTALPVIFGTAQSGQTLSASPGSWSGSPNSYSYQWKAGGTNIAGATSSTFLLTNTQVGATITVTVVATNIIGPSLPATSAATAAVIAAAPVFSVQPSIAPASGAAGSTFTGTDGTASNTTGYTRRWLLGGTSIGTGTTVVPATPGSLVLEVTATGAGGSAVANSPAATVTAAVAQTIINISTHTDSLGVGVQDPDDDPATFTNVTQTDINGASLTTTTIPLRQAIAPDAKIYVSPFTRAVRRIATDTGLKVNINAGGYNGQSVIAGDHELGILPDSSVTVTNIARASGSTASLLAAYPGATILPVWVTFMCSNDVIGGADPATMQTALVQVYANLRTATGFSSAPIVVCGILPEHYNNPGYNPSGLGNGNLLQVAQRIAAIKNGNYFVRMPAGYTQDNLHTSPLDKTREIGADFIAPVIEVALGKAVAPTPDFSSIPAVLQPVEGTTTPLSLPCDQPIYYTAVTVGGATVQLSGDLEFLNQVLKPVAGTWPTGFTGTVTLSYRTGWGVTGTITRTVTVQTVASAPFALVVNAPTSPYTFTAVAGLRYIVTSWGGVAGGFVVSDGSPVTVLAMASGIAQFGMATFISTAGGSITLTGGQGFGFVDIMTAAGLTPNGSTAVIDEADRSGPWTAPNPVTGKVLAAILATSGATANMIAFRVNSTFVSEAYSTDTITPSGTWNGFTALIAAGFNSAPPVSGGTILNVAGTALAVAGDGLSVTCPGYYTGIAAAQSSAKSTGKYYFEALLSDDSMNYNGMGITKTDASLEDFIGAVSGLGYASHGGVMYHYQSIAQLGIYTPSGVARCSLNCDTKEVRFAVNGGAWSAPFVMIDTPPFMPCVEVSGDTCTAVARFDPASWQYTPFDGTYGPWTLNAVSAVVWAANFDDNTIVDITGGGKTVTFPSPGSENPCRSDVGVTTDWVASYTTPVVGSAALVGLCDSSCVPYDQGRHLWFASTNYNDITGGSYNAAASVAWTTSDRVDIACKRSINRAWFGKNGTWYNGDPVAGTGGIDISVLVGPIYLFAAGRNVTSVIMDPLHTGLATPPGFVSFGQATGFDTQFNTSPNLAYDDGTRLVLRNNTGQRLAVRGRIGHDTGKWYAEFMAVGARLRFVGVVDDTFSTSGAGGPAGVNRAGLQGSALIAYPNIEDPIGDFASPGTIVRFAYDAVQALYWLALGDGYWNDSASAEPTTGVGGLSAAGLTGAGYLGVTLRPISGAGVRYRLPGDLGYSLPAGYQEWST